MEYDTSYMLKHAKGKNLERIRQLLQNENNDMDIADDPYFSDTPLTESERLSLRQAEQQAKAHAAAKNAGRSGRTFDTTGNGELSEIRVQVQNFLRKRKLFLDENA
jgi:hypothetical protein